MRCLEDHIPSLFGGSAVFLSLSGAYKRVQGRSEGSGHLCEEAKSRFKKSIAPHTQICWKDKKTEEEKAGECS